MSRLAFVIYLPLLLYDHARGPGVMASHTGCFGTVHFVAIDAARHRRDAGELCHHVQLRNLAVAGLAFHTALNVSAVAPLHSRE
jgi:hypothetical protein